MSTLQRASVGFAAVALAALAACSDAGRVTAPGPSSELQRPAASVVTAAHSAVARVFWTDRNNATLSVTDVGSGQTQLLVPSTGGRLQDVDLDANTGLLYFADWGPIGFPGSQGTINQIPKTGGVVTPVCATGTLGDAVHQLALDPVNQQIYFTRAVSYDDHEVSRVNYGPGCTGYTVSFLAGGFGGPGWFPSGLAHDPVNDVLYWGDIGVLNLPPNGSVNQMTASTLAVGPLPTQLTPHVNGRGRGFALDQTSQTIFLTAHNPLSPGTGGGLFSYDIVNGIETQLINDPGTGYWDIEIDPIGQRIWWTDYGRGEIRSAMFDGSDVRVELAGLTNPYGLALELVIEVDLDIRPTSCPNPLNVDAKGVLPAAILGTDEFDVADVDPATVALEGVSPLRWAMQDVATPFDGELVDRFSCTEDGPDGFTDLTLKFDHQAIAAALGPVADGDVVILTLTGNTFGGTPIEGQDIVFIIKK